MQINAWTQILQGDCLDSMRLLADKSVNSCVTSPPYYGLRDYKHNGQFGIETTPEEYIDNMVKVFREVKRILRDDGTLWLNIGDSYKNKSLIGIPWMLAFALKNEGLLLRQEIIWNKTNSMPSNVKDRCTQSHEQIFLLSKSPVYYFDNEAIKEKAVGGNIGNAAKFKRLNSKREQAIPGQAYGTHRFTRKDVEYNDETRNKRSVWAVPTKPYNGTHFAVFPPDLIEPCILAGTPVFGTVIDPFAGSGTVAGVAKKHSRFSILCELNSDYIALINARVNQICK